MRFDRQNYPNNDKAAHEAAMTPHLAAKAKKHEIGARATEAEA